VATDDREIARPLDMPKAELGLAALFGSIGTPANAPAVPGVLTTPSLP
jgi:hypothetical protein